jgi:hypothetical protein
LFVPLLEREPGRDFSFRFVMAGLVPAIHVFSAAEDVDARHKAGHDEV